MKISTCATMTAAIERILCAHNLLEEFTWSEEFAVRITNAPYMPLTIERQGRSVTITHYFEQNGDLIPDPDMEFEIIADHLWVPVAIQFATGHYRRARETRDGQRFINPREAQDQIKFSKMWAKNLVSQRFDSSKAEKIS